MAGTKKKKEARPSGRTKPVKSPREPAVRETDELPKGERGPGWGQHPPGPFVPSDQVLSAPSAAGIPSGGIGEDMLDRGGRSVRRELEIAAPPGTVFEALIRPVLLQQWCADEVRIEPRRGGVWQIRRLTDAAPEKGCFEDIRPPRRLAWSWEMARVRASTLVSLLLEPRREGAVLQLLHSGFGTGEAWDLELRHRSILWDETLWRLRAFAEEHRVLRTVCEAVEARAPADRVWQALTVSRDLNAWWTDLSRVDARPGGEFRLLWEGTGEAFGILEEVVPPARLKWQDQATGAVFAFDISPSDRGCSIHVAHSIFGRDAAWKEGTERFWRDTLRALKDHVESARWEGGRRR